MPFPELVTTLRVRLRRWDTERHTAALIAINAEPAAVEFLNDGVPYTAEQSGGQSERFATHWATHGFGLWAVEHHDDILGFAGLAHPLWFSQYASEVEVGWRLHPRAWGRGYATEAARAARSAASELHLERIIATIDPANTRSIAVALRLGMTLDATVAHPQRPGDIAIYAIPVAAGA
jgi:RimJ/RimL family protein N-acetyltransferase